MPGAAMRRHAERLRDASRFVQVEVALLNGAPPVAEALARIAAPVIRVVPFFMEDGYFSRVAIPRTLAGRDCVLCPPIGIHDGMAELIERRAIGECQSADLPPHTAAIVVIGHGSASAPGRALALHRHAQRLSASGRFARVEATCLEEPPFVADTLKALRSHPIVVIGFFANQGGHARDDVPTLIAAEQAARGHAAPAVRFAGCIADDAAMTQIILDQSRQPQTLAR